MDPKFTIDGREYPVPNFDSCDIEEWEILYDKTGLTLETVANATFSPGLVRTLATVAYRRGNPDVKLQDIDKIVGKLNFLDVVGMLASDEEEDAGPPAEAAAPSPPEETSRPDTSDLGSESGSGTLAVVPPPTGTPLSATLRESSRAASAS